MRNHHAVLHVYKDGEGCGLGRLWQEICKFTAHREKGFGAVLGVSHCSRHSWRKRPRNPGKSQLAIKDLVCAGRRVKGSCLEFQKAALALLTEPGMRGHLGQEAEKRHPGEGQVLGPAWKTHLNNLGCRWHVREKDCCRLLIHRVAFLGRALLKLLLFSLSVAPCCWSQEEKRVIIDISYLDTRDNSQCWKLNLPLIKI